MPRKSNPLAGYIDEVLQTRHIKTRKEIAHAIGMKESTFSKSVQEEGMLTVEQCIRLAGMLGVPVAGILDLTGRHDLARLANQMLEPSDKRQLSKYEWEMIQQWRQTTETGRQALYAVARHMRRAQSATYWSASDRKAQVLGEAAEGRPAGGRGTSSADPQAREERPTTSAREAAGHKEIVTPCWVTGAETCEELDRCHVWNELSKMYALGVLLDDDMILVRVVKQMQVLCESIRDRHYGGGRMGKRTGRVARQRKREVTR